ncbi:hypothetical protein [Deinococcus sp.]|nr:hypothetical protein [Deinococcus sp.]
MTTVTSGCSDSICVQLARPESVPAAPSTFTPPTRSACWGTQ